ncbi:glycosyltransferase family 39 protein [Pseudomonas bohemica]|uniref:glycosyltransferase family 39 protein n=1 Tax=Pseudomonas bohemica TaxID=2044872 RepID=UPI000DA5F1B5|nr:glycosyltransferase family 39 protein [Pseudomonas bohemica]
MNNILEPASTKDLLARWWWVPILLLAAAVRFYRLTWAVLWADEAFSLVMSTHSPAKLLAVAVVDVHPPLYYLMLSGWTRLFGTDLFSIRALSACVGVVTVGLGIWLTALIANRRAAIIAGVSLALLPIAVRYGQEVRMYALLGMWMTGATIALVYWIRHPRQHTPLAAYALLVAAGLYTHYLAITGVAAHWLYLATITVPSAKARWRYILDPKWWMANSLIGMLFVPWLPSFIEQLGHASNLSWIQPVTLHSVPAVLWQYLTLDRQPDLSAIVFWGIVPAILALCAYCILSDRQWPHLSWLLVIYCVMPPLIVFGVSLAMPLFMARYLLFSAIGLPILLGVALDRLARYRCWLAVSIFILVLGIEWAGLGNLHRTPETNNSDAGPTQERADEIADVIARRYTPGDQIMVLNLFYYPSLEYYNRSPVRPYLYWRGGSAQFSIKSGISGSFNAPYGLDLAEVQIPRLDSLPPQTRRVWLVDHVGDANIGLEIPCYWRLQSTLATGDNRLRLYDTDLGQAVPDAAACPTH